MASGVTVGRQVRFMSPKPRGEMCWLARKDMVGLLVSWWWWWQYAVMRDWRKVSVGELKVLESAIEGFGFFFFFFMMKKRDSSRDIYKSTHGVVVIE